ncbi:MAG: hypothetical protein V1734_00770 [Nanoarchaeota archaeon]
MMAYISDLKEMTSGNPIPPSQRQTSVSPLAPAQTSTALATINTSLAKIDTSLVKIMDSETAIEYMQKVSVPASDAEPYKVKLATSAADDRAVYDALVKTERQKFKKRTGVLARWFGRAEFAPSKSEPEKSTKTELLEGIVKMSDKIQRDVQSFADIPGTLAKLRSNYAELLQKEAAVRTQVEGYRETYADVMALQGALDMLNVYDTLKDDDKKAVKQKVQEKAGGADIDLENSETRQILCAGIGPEIEKQRMKIEIDFPFAKETYLSIQRQMADIEQYDAGEVREKFVPAMMALHRLRLRYDEAKVKADTASPAADLDGIIRSCNELVEETDRILEKAQIESDVDKELRKDAKERDAPAKPSDIMAEMDSLLGKQRVDSYEAPVQYAVQPEIIEAEFTEASERRA